MVKSRSRVRIAPAGSALTPCHSDHKTSNEFPTTHVVAPSDIYFDLPHAPSDVSDVRNRNYLKLRNVVHHQPRIEIHRHSLHPTHSDQFNDGSGKTCRLPSLGPNWFPFVPGAEHLESAREGHVKRNELKFLLINYDDVEVGSAHLVVNRVQGVEMGATWP